MDQPLAEPRPADKAQPRAEAGGWRRAVRTSLPTLGYLVPPLIALVIGGVIWELWVRAADTPTYIFPRPTKVLDRFFGDLSYFWRHGWVTLYEGMLGFALGAGGAILFAIAMAASRPVEKGVMPLAILVKVTPIVAIAPLFTIWFGFGSFPKVLIAAFLTFYPVLINAIVGFRSMNPSSADFLRSIHASPAEIFFRLRLPSSLPYLFASFRIVIPLALIGATVAEWFSGDRGLGSVIIVAHNNLDMPTLFSAIVTLALIGIGLTMLLWMIEKRLLFWHESNLAR
ncbi:MAG: ABC transporter permease [Chloroflexi bacterium]|nr:ABC transporter permease [Chloroflexota bacterium]